MNTSKLTLFIGTIILAALAMTGCSNDSDTTVTAIDTAPPATPTALNGLLVRSTGKVNLSWAPNVTDSDFAGFKMQRVVDGVASDLIATPTDVTNFIDDAPVATSWRYQLVALDDSGNESAYAECVVLADVEDDDVNLGQ